MGWLNSLLGIGDAARDVAEVFVENKTKAAAQSHAEQIATLDQFGQEFARENATWFDSFINGLNRLPRPVMAISTMALFGYAMTDPIGFSARMQGLQLVPDPLWWLLGAVVSFYFGAREMHHFRTRRATSPKDVREVLASVRSIEGERAGPPLPDLTFARMMPQNTGDVTDPDHNAAIEDWRALQGS